VSLPELPLIPLIYSSQVVNAVLLPLHVIALRVLASDATIIGEARTPAWARVGGWVSIALILACIGALGRSRLQ
jgi:Mn2+/Fe2+ NRAMP family transporter